MRSKRGICTALRRALIISLLIVVVAWLYFTTTFAIYLMHYAAGRWDPHYSASIAGPDREYVSLRPQIARPGDRVAIVVSPFTLESEPEQYSVLFSLNLNQCLPGRDFVESLPQNPFQGLPAPRLLKAFMLDGVPRATRGWTSLPNILFVNSSDGKYYVDLFCSRYAPFRAGFADDDVMRKQIVSDPWRVVAKSVRITRGRQPGSTVDRPLTAGAVFEAVVPADARSGWVGLARKVNDSRGQWTEIVTNYRLCYLMIGESDPKVDLRRIEEEWDESHMPQK